MSTILWQLWNPSQSPTSGGGGVGDGRTVGLGDAAATGIGVDSVGVALGGADEQAATTMAVNAIAKHRTDIGILQSERSLDAHPVAAALEEHDVAPAPGDVAPDPLLDTDPPEPRALMEGEAGGVLGKNPGEEGPHAGRLRCDHEGLE